MICLSAYTCCDSLAGQCSDLLFKSALLLFLQFEIDHLQLKLPAVCGTQRYDVEGSWAMTSKAGMLTRVSVTYTRREDGVALNVVFCFKVSRRTREFWDLQTLSHNFFQLKVTRDHVANVDTCIHNLRCSLT